MDNSTLDARRERLAAALAAAQEKLAARRRMDEDSIGAGLATLNEDLDQVVHVNQTEAQREYDRIEARLMAEKNPD